MVDIALLLPLMTGSQAAIAEVQIEYNPETHLEPHAEELELHYWSAGSGSATFPRKDGGPLLTADDDLQLAIPREKLKPREGATDRCFFRPFTPEEFNDATDLRIEAVLKVKNAIDNTASVCVQFTTPAGRTFGLGFFKDKSASPDSNQVFLYADSGEPLDATQPKPNDAWRCKPVVLGKFSSVRLDGKNTYILELLRNGKRFEDNIVRLSVKGSDEAPLTARLADLATREGARPVLLCGHPTNAPDSEATWYGLHIRTTGKTGLETQLFDTAHNFYRTSPGRYYRRRFTTDEFNDQTDLHIEATARVLSSIGSPASTCVQFTTPAGRTFGLGFLRDPSASGGDRVVLYADSGKPLEKYGYFYDYVDWLWQPIVLGTYSLPVDETRTYVLDLLRNSAGLSDDIVRLSIKGSDRKPLTARLEDLATRPTVAGLVFGHPVARGGGEAEWYNLTITTTGQARPSSLPRRIGNRRQLFLDNWIIKKTENLSRQLEKPEKYADNPVMVLDKPWEKQHPEFNQRIEPCGVAWNPKLKKLQIFYRVPCEVDSAAAKENGGAFLYAESSDGGRTWVKPNLGQIEFDGSKENNLIASGGYTWRDEHEPDPSKRYKSFLSANVSRDGMHWKKSDLPVGELGFSSDTNPAMIWNPDTKMYMAYIRMRETTPGASRGLRSVGCIESPDYVHWSPPELVYSHAREHTYSMGVTPYEGIYVGTPWFYLCGEDDPSRHDIVISSGLAVSRDGRSWNALTDIGEKEEYIPTGPPGSMDDRQIRMSSMMAVVDDQIVFVYGLNADPHVSTMRTKIGIATLRLDGFMPVVAGEEPGRLLTQPFVLDGDRIYVNAACEKEGSITVAMLDENGTPLPGLGHQSCTPVRGDGVRVPVSWKGEPELGRQRGQAVCLEFEIEKAKLYSFWCED